MEVTTLSVLFGLAQSHSTNRYIYIYKCIDIYVNNFQQQTHTNTRTHICIFIEGSSRRVAGQIRDETLHAVVARSIF